MRLCLALILLLAPWPALAAKSLALVIGNDSYVEVPALQKARADAQGYAAHFQALGYEVTLVLDAGARAMDEALAGFYDRIAPGDTVVFVFSGHGWSDGRQNFLLPVDIRAQGSETLLARESVALRNGVNGVVDEIALRGPGLTVAIIDACRNNPFQPAPGTRSVGLARGLAPEAAPTGMTIRPCSRSSPGISWRNWPSRRTCRRRSRRPRQR
ncbi:MAG: caspase family protein [Rhodobacteraceae bacterium]|nr:caspase family protein [Paracoccaceae bacterium]